MLLRRPGANRRGLRGFGGAPAAAPYSPLDLGSDLVAWWSARTGVADTGGLVDTITDQSPNGYVLTGTTTTRPTLDATGLGGEYPAIVHDGTDRLVSESLAALAGATGLTVVMVLSDADSDPSYVLEYANGGGVSVQGTWSLITNIGNANSLSFYAVGNGGSNFWRSATASEPLTTPKVISCRVDFTAPGASEISPIRSNGIALSGAQTGSNNNTAGMIASTLVVGADHAGGNPCSASWADLVIVKRALSDAELLELETFLG